jgi:hypothetical protein
MKKQNDNSFAQPELLTDHCVAPHNIDEHTWYYEEKDGIEIIRQVDAALDGNARIESIRIPWEKLTETVQRHWGSYN